MKTVSAYFFAIVFLWTFQLANLDLSGTECEVKQFYEAVQPDTGVKVITTADNLEEVKLILKPTKMEEGTSTIELTRKGSNIYQIDRTKYYIETRYCNEYANFEMVVVVVENNFGNTKGKIIIK